MISRQRFTINERLPSLNNYIDASRTSRYSGGNFKKRIDQIVIDAIKGSAIKPVKNYPIKLTVNYYEKDKRRDPDNIVSGKKYILDALTSEGIIVNDGWKQIVSFSETIQVDSKNVRVVVEITEGMKERKKIKTTMKIKGGKR